MSRLFKRNGIWQGWFYENGRRIQRTTKCTDRKAAEAAVREWERCAQDSAYAATHSATLARALEQLLIDRRFKGRSAATIECYRVKAGHVLRILGENAKLAEVDARAIDRYIELRMKEGAARNTVHKELTVVRATLKLAKRRGEYPRDIEQVMPSGFSTDYKHRTRFLTVPEAQRLLAELLPDRAACMAFIIATSARWGEAVRARREDIAPDGSYVRLRGTKTEQAERIVPMVGWAQPLIAHALDYCGGKDGLMFKPWDNVRHDLEAACERAGIAKVTPNDLRRTCATWLRQNGVEPHLIGCMLGHRDSRMVERVYGRMPVESLRDSLERRLNECSKYAADANDLERNKRRTRPSEPSFFSGNVVPRVGIEPTTRGFSGNRASHIRA